MEIDRLTPTQRPTGRPVQYQRWNDLLFLHWRVPVAVLRGLIPTTLEIDTFEGEAWVGVVPFSMREVRPSWAFAVPPISNFEETNVRTYVHREGRDPGVWFFSLDAANALAVWIARTFWDLPYFTAAMSIAKGPEGSIAYRTARKGAAQGRLSADYRPLGSPSPARPGTLEHFLAERYVLYAPRADGSLRLGRVHHTPYPLERVELRAWSEDLTAAAGIVRPDEPPLVHYAAGVSVDVFALEDL